VYVCVCNGVTDHEIRQAVAAGCGSMTELTMRTGCGASCGSCVDTAVGLLEEETAARTIRQALPLANAA
jgi:bacterioferritin-associated ferredoxin